MSAAAEYWCPARRIGTSPAIPPGTAAPPPPKTIGGRHRCQPPVAGRPPRGVAAWFRRLDLPAPARAAGFPVFGHRGRWQCFAGSVPSDLGGLRHRSGLRYRSSPVDRRDPRGCRAAHRLDAGSLRHRLSPAQPHSPKETVRSFDTAPDRSTAACPRFVASSPRRSARSLRRNAGSPRRCSTASSLVWPFEKGPRRACRDLRPTPAGGGRPTSFLPPFRLRAASGSNAAHWPVPGTESVRFPEGTCADRGEQVFDPSPVSR